MGVFKPNIPADMTYEDRELRRSDRMSASASISHFERAVRAEEMIGAACVENRNEIDRAYRHAKRRLVNQIIDYRQEIRRLKKG